LNCRRYLADSKCKVEKSIYATSRTPITDVFMCSSKYVRADYLKSCFVRCRCSLVVAEVGAESNSTTVMDVRCISRGAYRNFLKEKTQRNSTIA